MITINVADGAAFRSPWTAYSRPTCTAEHIKHLYHCLAWLPQYLPSLGESAPVANGS